MRGRAGSDHLSDTRLSSGDRSGESPRHRIELSVDPDLAQPEHILKPSWIEVSAGRRGRQGEREVEGVTALGAGRWDEVQEQASLRHPEPALVEGVEEAPARLTEDSVREPRHHDLRPAGGVGGREAGLNPYDRCLRPLQAGS